MRFSIVIPYKDRLDNITAVFASLADQTMDRSQFEVVVGAMEFSEAYVRLCKQFTDRINIVSILSSEAWNLSRARNLALRNATGEVVIILCADILLPANFLVHLYESYYSLNQSVCVLGQVRDYGIEVARSNIDAVEVLPYRHYRKLLAELETASFTVFDQRWMLESAPLPWTLVWGGLVALPNAAIARHDLFFDEKFQGYGPEDQEWGYRIHAAGIPIVLGDKVYGLHHPHARNAKVNHEEWKMNHRYFLEKWPCLEVELLRAFGWQDANHKYRDIKSELSGLVSGTDQSIGAARGRIAGADRLVLGVTVDRTLRLCEPDVGLLFDETDAVEVLPLVGLALPFPDRQVEECHVRQSIMGLRLKYRTLILHEAERVSENLVTMPYEGRENLSS